MAFREFILRACVISPEPSYYSKLISYSLLSADGEKIFAGVDNVYGGMSTMSEPQPTAKGSLCYYKSKEGEDKWRESETFRYWISQQRSHRRTKDTNKYLQ